MKITYLNGTTGDTDSMGDMHAMIAEKQMEVLNLFRDYKVPFLLCVSEPNGRMEDGAKLDLSHVSHSLHHPTKSVERVFRGLLSSVARFVVTCLGPGYRLALVDPEGGVSFIDQPADRPAPPSSPTSVAPNQ